ncbi:MAG: DUF6913 domain-containing protein [Bacteroidota bacterium]
MRGFLKIRTALGNYILKKKIKNSTRNKQLYNFNTAKSAGILFDASDTGSFSYIKEFSRFLKSNGIKTQLLGYIESKEVPDEMVLWDDCNIVTIQDIDWFLKPKSPEALDFIAREFNILFDLSLTHYFTMCYISKLSSANFKVGRYTDEDNDYDLMIDITKNPRVDYFIEHINNYLSILNNPKKQP